MALPTIQTIFQLPTLESTAQSYRDYVTAQNAAINPNIPGTDFYFKSEALAGIITGAIGDASYYFINMFPQYLTGIFIDLGLSARGLPARQAASYATVVLGTNTAPAATFVVQAGMQLNNTSTGAVFQIVNTATIDISNPASYNNILAICTVSGSGNQQPVNTNLYFASPPIDSDNNPVPFLIVQSSTDGSNAETDTQADERILNGTQIPRSGSRITDYYYYALDANIYLGSNIVTDAITIPNNQFLNTYWQFGVFGLGGTPITDYTLNQSLLYGTSPGVYTPFVRNLDTTPINAIAQSINNNQLVNILPWVDTVYTQNLPTLQESVITPFFQITVTLYTGYDLATVLQINSFDQNGNPVVVSMTVENLIKREVRRAICSQPFGATQTIDQQGAITGSIILVASIEQQLDTALGTSVYQGVYATILIDRQIYVYQSGSGTGAVYGYGNIVSPYITIGIPNPPSSATPGQYPLGWIYDIADNSTIGYNNIIVRT